MVQQQKAKNISSMTTAGANTDVILQALIQTVSATVKQEQNNSPFITFNGSSNAVQQFRTQQFLKATNDLSALIGWTTHYQ